MATFNTRAIRLYELVGFIPLNTFLQYTNGGEYEFLRMVRPAQETKSQYPLPPSRKVILLANLPLVSDVSSDEEAVLSERELASS